MENLIYLRTNLEFLKKIFSEDDIAISSDLNFQKKYEGKLRRNSNKYFEFSYEYNGTIDLELEMDSIRYIRNSYFSFKLFDYQFKSRKNDTSIFKIKSFNSFDFEYDLKHCFRNIFIVEKWFNLAKYVNYSELGALDYSHKKYSIEFLNIKLENINFRVYTFQVTKECYTLIIESDANMDINSFCRIRSNILLTIGFITGHFYNSEQFLFSDFKHESNFLYELNNRDYITFGYPIERTVYPPTDKPMKLDSLKAIYEMEGPKVGDYQNVSSIDFSKLVNTINQKPGMQTALRLFIETQNTSIHMQPFGYFGCLEILTNSIVLDFKRRNNDSGLTIKEKAYESLLKYNELIENDDFENLIDAINLIGKTQNNKVYIQAFAYLNILLSVEDKKLLNRRNDFFHGRITKNNQNFPRLNSSNAYYRELSYISLKLNILIRKLVSGVAGINLDQQGS